MHLLLLSAFGLGLAYNATPGAVNTEAIRRGLARGFGAALLVQLGALIGDTAWAAIALTGATVLVRAELLRLVLGIAGGCFLLSLAWGALREAWEGGATRTVTTGGRGDFVTGAFFSLANPFGLAFWLGIGAGVTAPGGLAARSGGPSVFLAWFVLGALCWCVSCAGVVGWGRRFAGPSLFRPVNALCGVALSYFGLTLLWNSLRLLVG